MTNNMEGTILVVYAMENGKSFIKNRETDE
jgi:hypothetical protein